MLIKSSQVCSRKILKRSVLISKPFSRAVQPARLLATPSNPQSSLSELGSRRKFMNRKCEVLFRPRFGSGKLSTNISEPHICNPFHPNGKYSLRRWFSHQTCGISSIKQGKLRNKGRTDPPRNNSPRSPAWSRGGRQRGWSQDSGSRGQFQSRPGRNGKKLEASGAMPLQATSETSWLKLYPQGSLREPSKEGTTFANRGKTEWHNSSTGVALHLHWGPRPDPWTAKAPWSEWPYQTTSKTVGNWPARSRYS